jgi:hypothetical protein
MHRLPSFRRALAALAALALAAAAACSDSPGVIDPGNGNGGGRDAVAAVAVAAPAPSLVVGERLTATATPKNAAGAALGGRPVAWSSSAEGVATVSAAGEVTAVAPGTVRIGATSEGKRGEVELTVLARPAVVATVSLDATTVVLGPGETRQLTATPRDAGGAPVAGVAVEWTVSGAAATVSPAGLVTAREMGVVTVAAVAAGRRAEAAVTVLGDASHDLVFDRWSQLGSLNHPVLHRLDMRTPGAEPVRIGQSTSTQDAAPSPDGTRIAFVCGPSICVADRDGANGRVLPGFDETTGPHGDQPAWSPDGTRIAFRGWMPGGPPGIFNPADVWVMDADGSNKVRLTSAVRGTDAYESPAWSPRQADGSYRIAYALVTRAADGTLRARIASVRADGADPLPVTAPGEYADAEPAWSPDGRTIAFVRTGGTAAGDVWLVDARAGNERPLMAAAVEPSGAQRAPAWSPDGGLVAFASNHEIVGTYFAWQIYTVRADGTGLVRRTGGREDTGNPAWLKRP